MDIAGFNGNVPGTHLGASADLNASAVWTLIDEKGRVALSFSSFMNASVTCGGQVLSSPVEEGGFVNYNKVESPLEIKISLAFQGSEEEVEQALAKLREYKRGAIKLLICTPVACYENMTLESFSYDQNPSENAHMLIVNAQFKEVRELAAQASESGISSPKNPTSAPRKNTGKSNPLPVPDVVLCRAKTACFKEF